MKKSSGLKSISTAFILSGILFVLLLAYSCKQETKPIESSENSELFDRYIQQTKAELSNHDYQKAVQNCDSAITVAHLLNDLEKEAQALIYRGVALRNDGEYNSAKTAFFRARSICIANRLIKTQARLELSIGTYYSRIGKNDSSLYYGKHAIKLYEKIVDSAGIARALNSYGANLKELDRRDEALQAYYRALEIYQLLGDEQRQVYVLNNIGTIHQFYDEYDKALELFKKCKAVSTQAENLTMTITSSMNIAGTYYFSDKTKEAEHAYLEVIELIKEQPNDETLAAIYVSLGAVYAELEQQELSFEYLTKALQIAKQHKNLRTETHANYKLGHYYLHNGNTLVAEEYFKKTIEGAEKVGDVEHLSHSYLYLSSIQEDNGDYKSALSTFKLSKELNDSIINEKKLKVIIEMENKYQKKNNEAEILRLSNEYAEKEIQNRDLKFILVTTTSIVFLLMGVLFYIRLKNKKNKIIAEQKINQLEEERKLLAAQSVIVGQEEERKRIAQELHDGIGVLLSTASIHFSNVEEKSEDEKTTQLLHKANELLKQAGGEVRKISHDMMPGVLSKFGLQEALEDMFESVEDAGGIEIDCRIDLSGKRLAENTEIIVYRVIQEILNNTLKHAKATFIEFKMKKDESGITIRYRDNGKGFNQIGIQTEKSLGLSGIKSRIDFLKGEMKLVSTEGNGVQYDVRIPA